MRPKWIILWLCLASLSGANEPTAAEKLFALHVKPLLVEKCLACHGQEPDKIKGGLDLTSLPSTLAGGETFGPEVLIPGNAAKSHLYLTTTRQDPDYAMPPKEADKLTEEQTWYLRDWINGGAPWLSDERVAEIYKVHARGVIVPTSGGLGEEWTNRKYLPENIWAYQPVQTTSVPPGANPVDHFIDLKLNELKLPPAPPADRRTLIRRATFDLHGLPPTPEAVAAFLADPRPDAEAFAALVDSLLASPHYGEQAARHWLDVVRYADSSGFANDYERPNAWRYRDYVIRAFNADKPYDRFIREQLAGDELDAANPELLIATGFLRMGPWEHTGMSVAKVTRQFWLDDVTDSVGQVFLAHALQCARCHDHKFDPVPTRDYYSIQAVFATTQFAEIAADWLPEENKAGMEEDQRYHQMRAEANARMLAELTAKKQSYERAWFQERGLPFQTRAEAVKAKAPEDQLPIGNLLKTPDEFGRERIGRKWEERFTWEFDRYRPIALAVYDGKTRSPKGTYARILKPPNPLGQGELEQTAILGGGDVFAPTLPVKPGILSAEPSGREVTLPETVEGRRLALADWIASPDNSLTARVMANRLWQSHFGQGLAGNPSNFGATGEKPTHPALLDWLAGEFVKNKWSVKHLHRAIMNSAAYRRASAHPDAKLLAEKDPSRETYAVFQPRRLAAEELRDAMLFVTGELNPEMGGIPIRPDMNLEAALQPRMIMGTFAPSYVPNPRPEQRNRRTIYAHKTRGLRDPLLELFNQPGPDKSCELRDSSNVTPQVFALFNSEESADRALALAHRVMKASSSPEEALRRAFQLTCQREPSAEELAACLSHWKEMESAPKPPARSYPKEVVREANEENTGQPFTFSETLFVYRDYVPDLQPEAVDARTRALAEVCLVLLNANEFVYVY